jgi:Ser/Thr protein kinase RdoA (MazF antagonist)
VHPAGWRSRAETEGEVEAVLTVARAGGAAARPMPLRTGGYVSELDAPEGPRSAVLFENAPGADLSYLGKDGATNAWRYGEASARLHDACDAVTGFSVRRFDLDFIVTRPAAIIAPFLDPDARDELDRLAERLSAILLAAGGDLTTGFCHGDLNCQNLHFVGEAATAIDFDCCAWGWRAFELAGFARGVAYLGKPGDAADALIAAQIEGYSEHRPIAPADLAVLPAMLLAQRMWVVSLHLEGAARWGAINFDRPYAARALAWLRAWAVTLDKAPVWAAG